MFHLEENSIIELTRKAGEAIMNIYNDPNQSSVVDFKSDDSPLTLADEASHNVIVKGLIELHPDVPIISEEGENLDYQIRKEYNRYWLVDPLDGTKEFINRNGEFTVNIALIENGRAVAGFVFAPYLDELYYGIEEVGAFKISGNSKLILKVNNSETKRVAVRSKSHPSVEEESVLKQYNVVDSISVGSSLKFCMVAEGKADVYYRFGPTMEWDTAAGHAVVNAAGGKVLKNTGPEEFIYNKENLLNSSFLCLGF
ncbi:3'(2'),5'-bisphosphate nucleotidase CysQ [Fulvivirga lutimaris]|uniref:3'(2'),5'-bisphosphate nucleotidase CysQ n=1 Tax=Fulvivirga lutimaris TaxID=1819566 RepID=UPI0012BCC769|nr:3'(2'),5'-bisphosphate nucleotidase CysQ [Fulvivirga lutimaris]MTI39822.1 3'(2'),5'-bisphosphate nucleotidase [Fulvivirga lutimaris]